MKRCIALGEMVLLISVSFAFSWLVSESYAGYQLETRTAFRMPFWGKLLSHIGNALFSELISVSALVASDLQTGQATCPQTKTGAFCQEFPSSECAIHCQVPCEAGGVAQSGTCKPGTCLNRAIGSCTANTGKTQCESGGGQWFDSILSNVAQCSLGCCVAGGQSYLTTELQCQKQSQQLGIQKLFKPEIRDELTCLAQGKQAEEGACLLGQDEEGKNLCSFGTRQDCQAKRGDFRSGFLCSSPALNTSCQAQQRTSCVPGKDGVYWFDSCGNRENVYALPKATSNNQGRVQPASQACSLVVGNNPVGNKATCGNCNYIGGSICRVAKPGEVSIGQAVCGDLSCTDAQGNKRANGESWCAYQGSVGMDQGRGTDPVGGGHFRNVCLNGQIKRDACAEYRNELCVEAKTATPGGSFSTAACRLNRWQECIAYNDPKKPEEKEKCGKNPDCFVKQVAVGDFAFGLCAPRYPPGFLLDEGGRGEGAEGICSIASQKCTKVMVKGLGGWKCKAGCQCDSAQFTQQLNDLCISLGDCGMKANYLGTTTDNYKVTGAPALSSTYKADVVKYADETLFRGKVANPGTLAELMAQLGVPPGLGLAIDPNDPTASTRGGLTMPIGAVGAVAALLPSIGTSAFAISAGQAFGQGTFYSTTAGTTTVFSPAIAASFNIVAGAAIGFAVVSFLLDFTGVGRGLPPALTYGLMAAGAIGGAIIGASMTASGSSLLATLGIVPVVGWIILIVVIVIIVILSFLGIGKVKKIESTFQCKPWQAPTGGGGCATCGSDGFPCSRYACSSLGQTCELINEGTDEATCISTGKDDIVPPKIKPWTELITQGHSYQDVGDLGFTLAGPERCLEPFSNVLFGIQLDEPGRCKIDRVHTAGYADMSHDFGLSSLFRRNHTMILPVPSLEDLGYTGYQTNLTGSQTLYVRCQDKQGNTNVAEYALSFCVRRGLDVVPPVIVQREPLFEYISWLTMSANASISTSEPADCRVGTSDRDYDQMTTSWPCANNVEEDSPGLFGWVCRTMLSAGAQEDTPYYVRCRDQPWLANSTVLFVNASNGKEYVFQDSINQSVLLRDRDPVTQLVPTVVSIRNVSEAKLTNISENGAYRIQTRNTMQTSYVYHVRKSKTPLTITSLTPMNETVTFGATGGTVTLDAQTNGGVDGTAVCSYLYAGNYIQMLNTGGRSHRQPLQLTSGTYTLQIRCEDPAGTVATESATFTVALDNIAPLVARVYGTGNAFTIITNEPADCRTSEVSCQESWTNGTLLSGSGQIHTGTWGNRSAFQYIQCYDRWLNGPGSGCSAVVRQQ